jgi:hypothetical protein
VRKIGATSIVVAFVQVKAKVVAIRIEHLL